MLSSTLAALARFEPGSIVLLGARPELIPRYRRYHRPMFMSPRFWSDNSCRPNWSEPDNGDRRSNVNILMVLTSHDTLGNTGEEDGILARRIRGAILRFPRRRGATDPGLTERWATTPR